MYLKFDQVIQIFGFIESPSNEYIYLKLISGRNFVLVLYEQGRPEKVQSVQPRMIPDF